MLVHQIGRTGCRRRCERGGGERRWFLSGGSGNRLFSGLAILNFEFDNPKVQPFDFLQGKHVDFSRSSMIFDWVASMNGLWPLLMPRDAASPAGWGAIV